MRKIIRVAASHDRRFLQQFDGEVGVGYIHLAPPIAQPAQNIGWHVSTLTGYTYKNAGRAPNRAAHTVAVP